MVYHNAVAQSVTNPTYENETFRAKHGYKETHQHDPAYRRNRDFKPVPYGTFRGMPNYKHSEPYCLLKNMKDLTNEEHHHPIKWIKMGLKGALTGSIFGYLWFLGGPTGPFEMNKLMAATGNRPYSGRGARMFKSVLGKYAFMGASLTLSYQLINDFLRHHDETNSRPQFFDHMIATTLIGTGVGALVFNSPLSVFCSGFFSIMMVTPVTWWFKTSARLNPKRASNIFYENDCSKEEIERFRHQDVIENMGMQMLATPGYGYHSQADPRGL